MRARGRYGLLAAVVLIAVVVPAALSIGGCSASEVKDKAVLSAALGKFNVSAAPLVVTVQSTDPQSTTAPDGKTVAASLREGRDSVRDDWQSVINAAKKVEGADAAAAERAWAALDAAVTSVPEDATGKEAGSIIGGPVNDLLKVQADLWAVVKPE